ncbi:MAG: hypothetical protein K2Y37_15495 [Pirellulales bacterium]|nr:hypothetical protein [Pirellulales bacterium]
MARKTVSHKEMRREVEAAERADATKEAKPAKKKAASDTKRKSRAKTPKIVRLKAFWGVFNQSMKRVAVFDYNQRKQADQRANELTTNQKTPHFVQLVKEVIQE